ncbi:uncharacterized protein LOC126904190 [Daktulosphaira vitifoliae]|uniref:uncharacterized protein LOC126904190 n=1 Tax=Daktulosphaira vitifoliae TaxID=58002 RepID=UPI0021A99875|nr:uncharacterized protein LOC126904190 [Daktulosphaira vitifoliae]
MNQLASQQLLFNCINNRSLSYETFTMAQRDAFVVLLALLLVTGCLCRPKEDGNQGNPADTSETSEMSSLLSTSRTSRLQKPSQVLNIGFDEIVVESNLQVHSRVGSKNKSKIMLPSNTTAQASSSRSLEI